MRLFENLNSQKYHHMGNLNKRIVLLVGYERVMANLALCALTHIQCELLEYYC